MENDSIQIEVKLFKDISGNQTCASDFQTGKCCEFLTAKHFGTVHCCFYTGDKLLRDSAGFLVPSTKCRLHRK